MQRKFLILFLGLLSLLSCTPAEKKISGTLEIQPNLQKSLQPEAALYIIARKAGEPSGPPLAVKRFTAPFAFPLSFQITKHDTMIPNAEFEGPLNISARIAQKGSATPALPGDIEGEAQPNPVSIGEKNLKILLNRTR